MAFSYRTVCRFAFAVTLLVMTSVWTTQSAAAFSGKRVALIIGNSKYASAPLKNPVNDARAMARTLKELGFEVTLRENAGQRDMAAAVRQFGAAISPGSAAVFYFAGHGMQVKGRNYLVPIDADIQVEDEVPYSTIDVNQVLDKLEVGKSAINIVILDACRNNPFARRFRSSGTGLAQMDAPIGTLIAFATAPGSVAQDGTGENGVYTRHLLDSIAVPGLPVEQMFKRVRVGVAKDTNEAQVPWESSSMKGDFTFREAPPKQAVSQDKLIEEAVKAAVERTATLTAERMRRDQAENQAQSSRAKAEQDALAAERELLRRERERLTAETEALRRKPAQAPETVALAAPAPVARPPAAAPPSANPAAPAVGDSWTYRYSDLYGKSETYTVRVTSVSSGEITDEIRLGKSRHSAAFEPVLGLTDRNLGNLILREISPYLLSHGSLQEKPEWKAITVFEGSPPFKARLAGSETVRVPAGSFEAQKLLIEGTQSGRSGASFSLQRTYTITAWYAPTAKRVIKMTYQASGQGMTLSAEKDIIELVETSLPIAPTTTQPREQARMESIAKVASLAPAGGNHFDLPKVGDSWTYRFSDIYGKSEAYSVRVTSVSAGEIADEATLGKAKHAVSFETGLALTNRKLGNLALREISPYLLSQGPLQEKPEWKEVNLLSNSPPFAARLAGNETIQVPAGRFETQKVVIEGLQFVRSPSHTSYLSRNYTVTVWYAPAARRTVKILFEAPSGALFSNEKDVIELTEYRLQ